jgi:hypothetical protein
MAQDKDAVPGKVGTPEIDELEEIVLVRVMHLNVLVNGLALGVIGGMGLFIVTMILVLKGGPVVGPHLGLLAQYLPGYDVTVGGSFIGLGYGLLLGFAAGAFIAWVYNWLARQRAAAPTTRERISSQGQSQR